MAGSPKFRVDVIFHTLRELEEEKGRLLNRLIEQKTKNKTLEEMAEAGEVKYRQTSDINMQMKVTVNVAKQKVIQTEDQIERLKKLNEEKRKRISELNQKIEAVNQKEREEVKSFENNLSELAEKFRSARDHYSKENLQNELKKWNDAQEGYKKKVDTSVMTLNDLTDVLKKLELESDKIREQMSAKLEYDLTAQNLQCALDTFADMKNEAGQLLQNYQSINGHLEK